MEQQISTLLESTILDWLANACNFPTTKLSSLCIVYGLYCWNENYTELVRIEYPVINFVFSKIWDYFIDIGFNLIAQYLI